MVKALDMMDVFTTNAHTTHTASTALSTPSLLKLQRTADHLPLFGQLIERVSALSRKHGFQHDQLTNTLWNAYASQNPLHGFWVITQGDAVIAHLVADIRLWDSEYVAWILQCDVDPSQRLSNDLIASMFNELQLWIADVNTSNPDAHVTQLYMASWRDSVAWLKRFGFSPDRTLYTRRIHHGT